MKVRRCTNDDTDRVDAFMREHLYKDEPLARNVDKACLPPAGKGVSAVFIRQGYSVVAEEDGQILGVSVNDEPPQSEPAIYSFTNDDTKYRNLFSYMERVSGVLDVAPGALELRIIAVSSAARNRGVATRLIEESARVAKEEGFPWVKIYCTSAFSARVVAKLGWTLLYKISYQELRERVAHDLVVPPPPHTHVALYIKQV